MSKFLDNILNRFSKPSTGISKKANSDINRHMVNVQLLRLRTDVAGWRLAIDEAERVYYPHRVKMQRIFIDTILNGHVEACWNRRKDLTLLRDFKLCNDKGVKNDEATKILENAQWFSNFISYAIDAKGYGYSLISLGDLENSEFPDLSIIPRWNISPDRLNVSSFQYATTGVQFLEDEDVRLWNIWVPTPNENATSKCGFGMLYKVAVYEIYLRNMLGFNADYAQNYGQPIRVGKTTKTDEEERATLFEALLNMGSDAAILLDSDDTIDLVESQNSGTGHMVFDNFEQRLEKKISKIILGHADAMDSTPGRLGASQGDNNPIAEALEDCQTKDARFVEPIVNKELLPRLRTLGFNIPDDLHFEYVNNNEAEEFREREDRSNQATAMLFKTITDAGGKPDWKYFTDRTKIPVVEKPEPEPVEPDVQKELAGKALGKDIQNKLNKLYS